MNRFEQLIIKLLRQNDNTYSVKALNTQFQHELIKQRVSGSLVTAFRESLETLEEKKVIAISDDTAMLQDI